MPRSAGSRCRGRGSCGGWSSARVELGELGAGVRAAGLLARERGGGDEPGERVRVAVRARRGPRRVALQAGEAPDGLAGLAASAARSRRRRRRRRSRAAGRRAPASAARRPKTKHSLSEFDASRLAPCRPVQAHSPTAYRRSTPVAPVEVGDDPAHHVVAGGRDRDALRHRVQAGLAQRADDVREAARVDHRHVELARSLAGQVEDRAGDVVARRELVDEALAVRAVERRALAADGLGDQEALAALERRRPRSGGTG